MDRKRLRWWVWWLVPVAVFLGLRLAVLATSIDRLGHLGEGELAHADLAADLAAGLELRPLWDYQVVPFHGGTLISSLLFVPWSALFGLSYASLKGLALGYALVAMVAWMWLIHRWAGRGAALCFAWLYALAPPVLLRMQLTLWGTHAELNAVLAVCLVLAHRVVEAGEGARGRRLFWLGAGAGFALYFNYASVVFVGLLLAGLLVSLWRGAAGEGADPPIGRWGRASLIRSLGPLMAGLGLGLLPLVLTVLRGRGQLQVYGQGPAGLLEGAGARLLELPRWLLRVPALSPQMPPGPTEDLDPISASIHVCLFLAAGMLAWRARGLAPLRGWLPAVAGLYPFAFLVVFTAVHLPFTTSTSGTFGYCPRYAATLYPFFYAAVAALCAAGQGARRQRPFALLLALALALALALPAGWDDLKLIDGSSPDMARRFDAVRFVRAGLWGVDRRSLAGAERFLALDQAGKVDGETARGVRAVLGEVWYTDYWRFLHQPSDGPSGEAVEARVRTALEAGGGEPYRAGVAWGRAIALGQPASPPVTAPASPPLSR